MDRQYTEFETGSVNQLNVKIKALQNLYRTNENNHKEKLQSILLELAKTYLGTTQPSEPLSFTDEALQIHFTFDTEKMEDGTTHKRATVISQRKGSPNAIVLDLGAITK